MILPEEDTDLDEFIANLEPILGYSEKQSQSDDVTLHILRFKLEYDIKDLCESLGTWMGEVVKLLIFQAYGKAYLSAAYFTKP